MRDLSVNNVPQVCHLFADSPSAIRLYQAQIKVGEVFRNAHFGNLCRTSSMLIVVCEVVRNLYRVFVEVSMLVVTLPASMRCLVMTHYEERPLSIASFNPVQTLVGDDIRDITIHTFQAILFDEMRIPVFTLVRYDTPVVKAGRFVGFAFT